MRRLSRLLSTIDLSIPSPSYVGRKVVDLPFITPPSRDGLSRKWYGIYYSKRVRYDTLRFSFFLHFFFFHLTLLLSVKYQHYLL